VTDPKAERYRVRTLIERAGVAMLMNVNEEGTHIGRPMLPLLVASDCPTIVPETRQNNVSRAIASQRSIGN
jgi:hypothetical protein